MYVIAFPNKDIEEDSGDEQMHAYIPECSYKIKVYSLAVSAA